jgi:hypothetical protein
MGKRDGVKTAAKNFSGHARGCLHGVDKKSPFAKKILRFTHWTTLRSESLFSPELLNPRPLVESEHLGKIRRRIYKLNMRQYVVLTSAKLRKTVRKVYFRTFSRRLLVEVTPLLPEVFVILNSAHPLQSEVDHFSTREEIFVKHFVLILALLPSGTSFAETPWWTDLQSVKCRTELICVGGMHGNRVCDPAWFVDYTFTDGELYTLPRPGPECRELGTIAYWKSQERPKFHLTNFRKECVDDKYLFRAFNRFESTETYQFRFEGDDAHTQCTNNLGGQEVVTGSKDDWQVAQICRKPYSGEVSWKADILDTLGRKYSLYTTTESKCLRIKEQGHVSVECSEFPLANFPTNRNLVVEEVVLNYVGDLVEAPHIMHYGQSPSSFFCKWPEM